MMRVLVHESFDDLRSSDIRFLQEAARFGEVHVILWSDEAVRRNTGRSPEFPQEERLYLVQSLRYVKSVVLTDGVVPPPAGFDVWLVAQKNDRPDRRAYAESQGLSYRVLPSSELAGFPLPRAVKAAVRAPKVVVTGCFDWFHSGHVRFFEEVSGLGTLHVVVGSDRNLRLLKGDGHPMFPQDERRYQVASVRHVAQAHISTGEGWLDAEPEFRIIKPDIYAVNEDGDKPEKREFCDRNGIRYVVLRRTPRTGLVARKSTDLRGF
jgi:cytidyltransferase-like protein